jgi:hypothetical protein
MAVACLSIVCMTTPADADQCPRGQIYWKSKKSCVDKAEAAKLGFYHGLIPKKDEPAREENAEPPPAATEVAAPPEQAPGASAPPSQPSPYGELVLEEFAKAR